jgi:hypothetical protein
VTVAKGLGLGRVRFVRLLERRGLFCPQSSPHGNLLLLDVARLKAVAIHQVYHQRGDEMRNAAHPGILRFDMEDETRSVWAGLRGNPPAFQNAGSGAPREPLTAAAEVRSLEPALSPPR